MNVKIITSIVTAVFLLFAMALTAAADSSREKSSVWTKKVASDLADGKETYVANPKAGVVCFVVVRDDGDLDVSARDNDWFGKVAVQYTHVFSKTGSVSDYVFAKSRSADDIGEGRGYPVFSTHCAKLAGQLPDEVVKKFNGALGVRNASK